MGKRTPTQSTFITSTSMPVRTTSRSCRAASLSFQDVLIGPFDELACRRTARLARRAARPAGRRRPACPEWWAHFEFTGINIEPIILRKKIVEHGRRRLHRGDLPLVDRRDT